MDDRTLKNEVGNVEMEESTITYRVYDYFKFPFVYSFPSSLLPEFTVLIILFIPNISLNFYEQKTPAFKQVF